MKTVSRAKASFPATRDRTDLRPPPACPGMRIGLLGGSFNPPHAGHAHIARIALKRLQLDALWLLVTPGNPIKSHDDLASLRDRLVLCRALICHPRIKVTGFEAGLGSSYSAETIAFLKLRYAGIRFVWVMGADNLADFHRWQRWQWIMRALPIAVLDRPGYRYLAMSSKAALAFARTRLPEAAAARLAFMKPPAWCYLTIPLSGLSSTEIRRSRDAAQSHKTLNYLASPPVYVSGD